MVRFVAFVVFVFANAGVAFTVEPMDRIWLEPPLVKVGGEPFSPRAIIQRKGKVQGFDDKSITFVVEGESEAIQVASTRVIWVEPGFSDAGTIAALKMFQAEDYAASISPLLEAVSRGTDVWRAQWLSMHLWQAAYQAERYSAVLELVNQIDSRPLPPMIIGGMPVHWIGERLPPVAMEAAQSILAKNDSLNATKLVAASWILGQPKDQQAVAVLKSLSEQNERSLLAQLAVALLWRKTPPPEVLLNSRQWRDRLSEMPLTLFHGPAALAADRLEAAGATEESLELFLSVGMTPPRPDAMVRIAKARSVTLLDKLGQRDESKRVNDE